MRISEWSSDVCSSDLAGGAGCVDDADRIRTFAAVRAIRRVFGDLPEQIGFPVESDEFPVLEHAVEIGGFGLQYGTLGYDRFDMAVRNRIAQAVPDQPGIDRYGHRAYVGKARSEERRVGKAGVRTCRSRW